MSNYTKAAKEFIKLTNLKEGSLVRVTHIAKGYQHGWANNWVDSMDSAVGKTYRVESICEGDYDIGIDIFDNDSPYYFPFFCLEVIEEETVTIPLDSGDYDAVIRKDGIVEVGCQKISYETIERIFKAAYTAKYDYELIMPK